MGAEELIRRKKKAVYTETIFCPICNKQFNTNDIISFNNHTKTCCSSSDIYRACHYYPPSLDIDLSESINKYITIYKNKILTNPPNKNQTTQEKIKTLKDFIRPKKIQPENGTCTLYVGRNDLLEESIKQMNYINYDFYKELKISFKGEPCVDVGGVLREWFTSIFEILESDKFKLFVISDSKDFSYIINPFLLNDKENEKYLTFVGKLIAKAVYQNITINICLNKLIYKMILKEKIELKDLVFIDYPLYSSLMNILEEIQVSKFENPNFNEIEFLQNLNLTYLIEMKDCYNHLHSFELIKNGKDILVTNLNDYIEKRINFLYGIYEPLIEKIRKSIFNYLPENIITQFSSDDLESLINGVPFIDLEDWRLNTEYRAPYTDHHQVILWFWDSLANLTQKQLSNLLVFSTGSSRVPIDGFKALESNREKNSKFSIEMIAYVKNQKNFIKAHTCFNRIDLPNFPNKEELDEAIKFISDFEMLGFGFE